MIVQTSNTIALNLLIWNQDIPPSKSLLICRMLRNKLSTDDNIDLEAAIFPLKKSIKF